MKATILSIAAIYGIYLFLRWRKRSRLTAAAFNALLAKYTFSTLSDSEKSKVQKRTKEILDSLMNNSPTPFNGEVDKFGWYALAMNELGIRPAVSGYPGWNKVRNPFTAVYPGDPILEHTSSFIKSKFGVDITLSKEHKIFDQIVNSARQK